MNAILNTIHVIGIVPVIALDDATQAVPLARALTAGGIPAAEVTFRTAAGEEAIGRIARDCPEVLVGAGTVLNIEQCRRAVDAGARFIVSPGYNEELVAYCLENGLPVLPGCVNASDMTKAVNAGLEVVKFFPAEQSGGLQGIRALAPVFPKLRFMPTGGVNTKNMLDYLRDDRILACGGTWMVKKEWIAAGAWEEITRISREAVTAMLGLSLRRAVLPRTCGEGEDCLPQALRGAGLDAGADGVIEVAANSVERAVYHLGRQGLRFDESTQETEKNGRLAAVSLAGRFGGFTLRLVRA